MCICVCMCAFACVFTCFVRSYTRVCSDGVQSTLSVYIPVRKNTHQKGIIITDLSDIYYEHVCAYI